MNELRKRQRQLIPVNIIIAVISLIAAMSIIFSPLIVIDVGAMATQIVEMYASEDGENSEQSEDATKYMDIIFDSVGDLKLEITTYGMAKFAFSADPIEYVVDSVAEELENAQDDLLASVVMEFIPNLIENSDFGEDLDLDTESIDVKEILNKFEGLLNAEGSAQVDQAIADLATELQNQAKTKNGEQLIPDEALEEIQKAVRGLYENAKDTLAEMDEELDLESFICVTISNFLNGNGFDFDDESSISTKTGRMAITASSDSDSGNDGVIYTNYRDLITGLLGMQDDGSTEDGENAMAEIMETLNTFVIPVVKLFVFVMLFFAGIWVIQFLFAFLHIFAKNKRFSMWYTKLLGFVPCLIFGVLPLIAKLLIPMLIPEAATMITGILGAITTLTWISGACYLALWIISIFWAFPIKRKIRKLIKSGATYK